MKHKLFFLALLSASFLFSCQNGGDKNSSANPNDCTEFACPMHPDHTSAVPAKCPECNMEMDTVKIKMQKDSALAH